MALSSAELLGIEVAIVALLLVALFINLYPPARQMARKYDLLALSLVLIAGGLAAYFWADSQLQGIGTLGALPYMMQDSAAAIQRVQLVKAGGGISTALGFVAVIFSAVRMKP